MSLLSSEAPVVEASVKPPAQTLRARLIRILPGLALLLGVGYSGKLLQMGLKAYGKARHITMPNIEYVLWSILIGAIIGNLLGHRRWFKVFLPGIATYEFWLKLGIVLLGARFLLADVLKLGGVSLALVLIEIFAAIVLMVIIGRLFGLGPKLTALLAVGSSVCGVSAIIATQGAIDADEKDASYAIAAILALGAVSLFTYPAIAHALGLSERAYGVWAGLSVDNTAEAAAAGALHSDGAGKVAVLTKTARNATIGLVTLGMALFFAARAGRQFRGSKAAFVWRSFPKFVLGFLLLSALASANVFDAQQLKSLGNLSRWAFLLTFAGVGLRTNLRELFHQGPRPFIVGAMAEVFVAVLTLGMVLAADRIFSL